MTTRRETGHLLRRAGFGPRPETFDAFASLSWSAAVDRLVDYHSVPDWLPSDPTPTQTRPDSDEPQLGHLDVMRWWVDRLVRSERPLEEKLTFFWHNHFATAISKVPPPLMAAQNMTLRAGALGNFRDLLLSVATDPAMLVYLDGHTNAAGSANENYARELFELHTLGIGHYEEADIKEAARALTGWVVRGDQPTSRFIARRYDPGAKTVFGRTGHWNTQDVVDLVMEHPAMPPFIVGKLARAFLQADPGPALLDSLSTLFVGQNFEIRPLVRAILESEEFRAAGAYRAQVKSPVEFVVGAVRALNVQLQESLLIHSAMSMGQLILDPPSPAGWPGGDEWINANSVLVRSNFANTVAGMRPQIHRDHAVGFDPDALLECAGAVDAASTVQTFLDLLCDGEIENDDRQILLDYLGSDFAVTPRGVDEKVRGLVYLLLASPLYTLA